MYELTRQELYDLVWTEPVAKVAERYHLSGAGLRKVCLKHNIPVPARGHWARIAAGQKVKRTRLPRPSEATVTVLLPRRTAPLPKREAPPEHEAVTRQKAFEANPRNAITIRSTEERLHPWTSGIRKGLTSGEANYRGTIELRINKGVIAIEASAGVTERVLQITDALGRAASKRKRVLTEAWDYRRETASRWQQRLRVNDVHFRFRLVEQVTKTPATPGNQREHRYWGHYSNNYQPNGKLRLQLIGELKHPIRRQSIEERATFSDKPEKPLEQQLHDVMIALTRIAANLELRHAEAIESHRLHQLEQARQAEISRQRAAEGQRLQALEELAERHARAAKLRLLIDAAERTGTVPGPDGAPTDLQEWLAWARAYTNLLDPIATPDNA